MGRQADLSTCSHFFPLGVQLGSEIKKKKTFLYLPVFPRQPGWWLLCILKHSPRIWKYYFPSNFYKFSKTMTIRIMGDVWLLLILSTSWKNRISLDIHNLFLSKAQKNMLIHRHRGTDIGVYNLKTRPQEQTFYWGDCLGCLCTSYTSGG